MDNSLTDCLATAYVHCNHKVDEVCPWKACAIRLAAWSNVQAETVARRQEIPPVTRGTADTGADTPDVPKSVGAQQQPRLHRRVPRRSVGIRLEQRDHNAGEEGQRDGHERRVLEREDGGGVVQQVDLHGW